MPRKCHYLPEIDGLRAFAVITVIINHFNKEVLPGGYLGVDIFFVISGYVITSSLQRRSIENFKDFITGFYERRVKRLIPVLALYVIITSAITHVLIQNAGSYYKVGILSLFGISNLQILNQIGGYWGFEASMNPFTQTWSLGVEEQFYILFPILVWFSGFSRKYKYGVRNLFLLVGFLSTISFLAFIHFYSTNPASAYFLMPTRFWEMATGCLIFLGLQKRLAIQNFLEKIPPLLILILIILVMYLPLSVGSIATIAVVTLTSTLFACLKENTFAYKFLSNPMVVYIGLMSYSLYLWHWGVISLARWSIGINKVTIAPLTLIIIIFSILSYELIEKRTRKITWTPKKIITIGIGLLISLIAASISFLLGTYFKARFYLGENQSRYPQENILPSSTFNIIGDSHSFDIYQLLKNNGSYNVKRYAASGCPLKNNSCGINSVSLKKLTSSLKEKDVVIFASKYLGRLKENKLDELRMIDFFKSNLPFLHQKGVITILKLPHPVVNPPKVSNGLICKKEIFRPTLNPNCFVEGTPKSTFTNDMKNTMYPILRSLKKEFPQLLYWDISNITCPEDFCFPVKNNKQYLRDSNHLFITSPTLSDELVIELNRLLSKASNESLD
tara:strand:+ start:494 stop:2344 length:1851 start_codon:yes stop_codon:yes gene_type:complete